MELADEETSENPDSRFLLLDRWPV